MPVELAPPAFLAEIGALKRGDDLARLVHAAAFAAADEQRASLTDGLAEIVDRAGITSDDAQTPYGNVLTLLAEKTPRNASARGFLSSLLARGVALFRPVGTTEDEETRIAESLLWLATNTPLDAFGALDRALGAQADGLWSALARLVLAIDQGALPRFGRAACVVGAAALRASAAGVAHAEAGRLATLVSDPIVRLVLVEGTADGGASAVGERPLSGELSAPPRSPVALVVLGVTGLLFAIHLVRGVARVTLGYRAPAELRVSARGVTLRTTTKLLGRTLREREVTIPIAALAKACRETRYPRVLLYAGLFSLAIGSYLGIGLCIDGVRAGSPELLAIGALLVAAGVALDFVLENARSGIAGKCRLVFLPRRGPALAISNLDPEAADMALHRLAHG